MKFTATALAVVTALAAPFLASGEFFFFSSRGDIFCRFGDNTITSDAVMMGVLYFSVGLRDDRTLEMRADNAWLSTFAVAMKSLEVAVSFASAGSCGDSAKHVLLFDSARLHINSDGEGVSGSDAGSM